MTLSKNRLLASIPKPPPSVLDAAQPASPASVTTPAATAPTPSPPKKWTRADRPKTPEIMGATGDDQRLWIRAQLDANAKKDRPKSASTVEDYRRKMANLDKQRDTNHSIPLSAMGKTNASFYANRAAVIYVATERARAALTEMARANRAYKSAKNDGDRDKIEEAKNAIEKSWHDVLIAGSDLAKCPKGKPGQYVAAQTEIVKAGKAYKKAPASLRGLVYEKPVPQLDGAWTAAVKNGAITPSGRSRSKRSATSQIQKKMPDWRNQVFSNVSEKWRTYTAIASVTGCRPEEIDGITFCLDKSDADFLSFTIKGAKHDDKKGHGIAVREFSIKEKDSRAFDHLVQLAKSGTTSCAPPPTLKNGKPLTDVNAAFRNAINVAGRTFIKQRKDAKTTLSLSPYCFRHSFACDIKASDYSMKTLAITLGHATTKTQQMYGRSNDGLKDKRKLKVDELSYNIQEFEPTARVSPAPEITTENSPPDQHQNGQSTPSHTTPESSSISSTFSP